MSTKAGLTNERIPCNWCDRAGRFRIISRFHGAADYYCWKHYTRHQWRKFETMLLSTCYRWKNWKRDFSLHRYQDSTSLPRLIGSHRWTSMTHHYWIRLGRWELRWWWERR